MRLIKFGLALALAGGLGGAVAEAQQGNTITVAVTGLANNTGEARCGLFNSAATFPKDGQQFMGVAAPISNQQAACTFNNVPPGTYAVAVFHAAHGETKMPTSLFGMPTVGYGFSRNAKISMGPPAFNSAAYSYPGGATTWPVAIVQP